MGAIPRSNVDHCAPLFAIGWWTLDRAKRAWKQAGDGEATPKIRRYWLAWVVSRSVAPPRCQRRWWRWRFSWHWSRNELRISRRSIWTTTARPRSRCLLVAAQAGAGEVDRRNASRSRSSTRQRFAERRRIAISRPIAVRLAASLHPGESAIGETRLFSCLSAQAADTAAAYWGYSISPEL